MKTHADIGCFETSVNINTLSLAPNRVIRETIELYGRERELRTIPLEPLVVLWFSQRPHRRWQTGARLFHSPTRAMGSASNTDTAARREPSNSVPVAVSTSFSRSKMLPIQPRNPTWTSITLIMWSFAHSGSGFCIFCLEGRYLSYGASPWRGWRLSQFQLWRHQQLSLTQTFCS